MVSQTKHSSSRRLSVFGRSKQVPGALTDLGQARQQFPQHDISLGLLRLAGWLVSQRRNKAANGADLRTANQAAG